MAAAGLAPDLAEVTLRADNDITVEGETAEQVRIEEVKKRDDNTY